ncbi:hypothetical protein QT979_08530 [Microcoleus sp. w2-18bC1]|uniref:hypothetical protein n=1 Tax=unclassified Microcoleus TaxID=2642155 RepID=UPI002FCF4BF9
MTFLKISVPVYKKNNWENLEKDGRIEVSSDVDNLSEGYQSLKLEIDKLLSEVNAENRLAKEVHELELEIENKAWKLKGILKDIEKATEHYESLKFFLQNLGVDPISPRLTFDKRFLPQEASISEVKVISQSEF